MHQRSIFGGQIPENVVGWIEPGKEVEVSYKWKLPRPWREILVWLVNGFGKFEEKDERESYEKEDGGGIFEVHDCWFGSLDFNPFRGFYTTII